MGQYLEDTKTNKNWVHLIILYHHEGRNRAHRMTITFLGGWSNGQLRHVQNIICKIKNCRKAAQINHTLKKKLVKKFIFVAEKRILEKWVKNRVSHRWSPLTNKWRKSTRSNEDQQWHYEIHFYWFDFLRPTAVEIWEFLKMKHTHHRW